MIRINPYKILGVSPLDDMGVVKSRYRELCKLYHPDNGSSGDIEKFNQVLKAWKYLEKNFNNKKEPKDMWCHTSVFKIKRRKF